MAEYIEREAALEFQDKIGPELFCKNLNGVRVQSGFETFSASNLIRFIRSIPTADVAPVRHRRWAKKHDDVCYWHECSECGERLPLNQWRQPWESPYCPNCGAKMDGESVKTQ